MGDTAPANWAMARELNRKRLKHWVETEGVFVSDFSESEVSFGNDGLKFFSGRVSHSQSPCGVTKCDRLPCLPTAREIVQALWVREGQATQYEKYA